MPVRMKHPEHGYHICYTPDEVEAHKLIGWVPEETESAVNPVPERNKPGRKPKVKHGD